MTLIQLTVKLIALK